MLLLYTLYRMTLSFNRLNSLQLTRHNAIGSVISYLMPFVFYVIHGCLSISPWNVLSSRPQMLLVSPLWHLHLSYICADLCDGISAINS